MASQDNSTINVHLDNGSTIALPSGASAASLAAEVKGEWRKAIAARVDGSTVDMQASLADGSVVSPVCPDTPSGREILRHSTAHVLAQAVLDLWPGASFAVGPAIEDGFYYDFDLPDGARFTEDDLERIEQRMREIIRSGQRFEREEYSFEVGLQIFADQPFKSEIIRDLERSKGQAGSESDEQVAVGDTPISAYRNRSDFVDLCRGPHVQTTSKLGHFKLLRVAGAYWRGDEHRPQLQRVYGTAWESAKALATHLEHLEESERRDHRRLGVELDLFHFPPEIGSGLPVFHPKGAFIRYTMEEFSRRQHLAAGYDLAWTPHVTRSTLFETSKHLQWYADGMFPPMEMEGATYYMKPMSCPMHILIYKDQSRSYRQLPLRLFELATVYRFERSGVLHGLARVRGLTQDDSHIFCAPEQLAGELSYLLSFVLSMLRAFGLGDFEAELATRNPDKFVGDIAEWDFATEALRQALERSGIPYSVGDSEAAFYAPKIDVHLKDAIGRRWQVSTLQVDLQLPQLFDLNFVGADNEKHRPFMIHRALFGSVERFFAILLEHFAGALPTWLCPIQVYVIPVAQGHEAYAGEVVNAVTSGGFRARVMPADETLGSRVRNAKMEKVPWILVVGGEDEVARTVGVNQRGQNKPERGVALDDFLDRLASDAQQPTLDFDKTGR